MRKDFTRNIRIGYGIFLSVLTGLVGLLFLLGAADIYNTGKGAAEMYSREIVGEHLKSLLVPACVWLVAVIGAFLIGLQAPAREARPKQSAGAVLDRLRRRIPAGTSEEFLAERSRLKRYDAIRTAVWMGCALVCLVAAVMSAVYIFDAAHFTAADQAGGPNGEVVAMLKHVLPWVGAAFLVCICAVIFETALAPRMLASVKTLLVLGKGAPAEPPCAFLRAKNAAAGFFVAKGTVIALRVSIAVAAVVLIALGIANGGAGDVLKKAVMICTECIGLG